MIIIDVLDENMNTLYKITLYCHFYFRNTWPTG